MLVRRRATLSANAPYVLKSRILRVNTVYWDTQESTARTDGGTNSA